MGSRLAHAFQFGVGVQRGEALTGWAVEAERPPLVARAVVAEENDQRIVEIAVLLKVVQDASHSGVDVLDHRGEGRHAAREVFTAILRQRIPGGVGLAGEPVGDVGPIHGDHRARRKLGVGREEAEGFLAFEPLGSENVPAAPVRRHAAVDVLLGRLQREMRRRLRQVQEIGPVLCAPGSRIPARTR